jgi:ABC-type transporter Mla MlaB component
MFRISVQRGPGSLTLQFEGELTGPSVLEAASFWRQTFEAERFSTVRFDLAGVTSIDAAGRAFLSAAYVRGTELLASGCLMRAIVHEIANTPLSDCG